MGKRFETLDSFRGLAAIFVVVHHMHYVGSITELDFFKYSFWFVEFFFILSGFVLAHGYAWKKNLQFTDYFIARTFRILPLHLFVLFAFIFLELLKYILYKSGVDLTILPFSGNNALSEILPNAFLLQAWLPSASSISFNAPAWSISIEYYMYMIFFMTLLFRQNLKYILWFCISVSFFILMLTGSEIAAFILRGLSSFFVGALTYLVYKNIASSQIKIPRYFFIVLEILLLLLVGFVLTSNMPYKALLMNLLFSLQVLIFAFEKGWISTLLKQKVFLYFGKLSYSIYMIHVIIIFNVFWVFILIDKCFHTKLILILHTMPYVDLGSPLYNNILVLSIVAGVIFVSGFTYRFIEQKGQSLGKNIRNFLSK